MRKFNFTNRIISVWNSLPDFVVSGDTVDPFKISLDRFWIDQEIRYNWMSVAVAVPVAVPLASWGTTAATRVPKLRIGERPRE